ncbi:preprotein translocase subunit SecG [bacterium]|nr:preprotein translocase subunit SecG [bacterium]
MITLLIVIHVLFCIALVAIILLQGGKGADLASVFGGGSSGTAFGVTGGATFISKLTTAIAIGFLVMSIVLSYVYTPAGASSVIQQGATQSSGTQQGPGQKPGDSPSPASGGTLGTLGEAATQTGIVPGN